MRPFTRTHRVFARLFPFTLGLALPFPFLVFVVEPNFFWIFQIVAVLMLPMCVHSSLRGRRRYREIHDAARDRGRAMGHEDIFAFTEAEIEEIGLIKGRGMATTMRLLSERVQRT